MYILSSDKTILVNCNNIASMFIKKTSYPSTDYWTIRVMYPAVSNDILYDTLCIYHTEKICRDDFNKLCSRIANSKENEIIDMNDL